MESNVFYSLVLLFGAKNEKFYRRQGTEEKEDTSIIRISSVVSELWTQEINKKCMFLLNSVNSNV